MDNLRTSTRSAMMSGANRDGTTTPLETMATTPVTDVPVTSVPPITTAPVTSSLGTQVPYFLGTFHPGFYTPTRLTKQGARALQALILLNPFTMYPLMLLMATGQLTQWGQFKLMAETYLLTKDAQRDSQWDPVGLLMGRTLQGGTTADTSLVWLELHQEEGAQTPPEEQVIMEEDEGEDEEDPWTTRLANLERG
ncbi:UNVERIFIED_CONTAM: hypothetical protein K2H54_058397 [Gekko kuhli]